LAGLHQTADIDIALGDYAVERSDHRGIVSILIELLYQVLLRRDVVFRGGNGGLLCPEVLDVDVALLAGHPAFLDQRLVPVPGHLPEPSAGLRLVQR
jgi:hypothetical protein